ncbi:MAG: triose-phosphate isomerase [Ferruginibacter sp.]|nr:triose-phosphate isomerase [Cytophagales bacterium]
MRAKIVAGNWKMNKTLDEGLKLVTELVNILRDEVRSEAQVVLAPPFPYLIPFGRIVEGSPHVAMGAQNCYHRPSGAYTGEVSAEMLASVGVKYVIIGHSERRQYAGETNEQLTEKVNLALQHGLTPIFCCGETLEQRQAGGYVAFVGSQLTESLFHLDTTQLGKIVIAYEPIWAIGTGVTASSAQAQEMHAALRGHVAERYGQATADRLSILYGGSVGAANARELFACPDVDGGLVGGASLKSRDFVEIVKSI